ncbi:response regulator transcription factor [Paenibacillus aceris]|uniref:DNA-binding NarL/FixJ family response regulator n=1 Tax=Paenibacillus aceris TaxID=869555 RepID=A0ABS4I1V2_9BACL|nr:response regulator transcription factor [Paenibacillus aceris]MBP1964894.1 DNA-binding NarL/FixJ family response regulator [Paenibacillus aceris]NHW38140.1 response regulator transcription factor [Paenibacillus aceris]
MTAPIRIIVAEDLDVLREHFCELIDREDDLKVIGQASCGKEVLKLIAELGAPELILMDIEMEMRHDGIITAQKVLELHPQTRIVFLTVHEDDETVFSAFETGAVDYVLKTSSSEAIIQSIRSAHAGNVQVRPEFAYKIKNEFSRIRRNQESLLNSTLILSQMTPSELVILDLLLRDMKLTEIAKERQVELSTIKSQINVILKKFNKKRTKEVTALLRELNVIPFIQKARGGQ